MKVAQKGKVTAWDIRTGCITCQQQEHQGRPKRKYNWGWMNWGCSMHVMLRGTRERGSEEKNIREKKEESRRAERKAREKCGQTWRKGSGSTMITAHLLQYGFKSERQQGERVTKRRVKILRWQSMNMHAWGLWCYCYHKAKVRSSIQADTRNNEFVYLLYLVLFSVSSVPCTLYSFLVLRWGGWAGGFGAIARGICSSDGVAKDLGFLLMPLRVSELAQMKECIPFYNIEFAKHCKGKAILWYCMLFVVVAQWHTADNAKLLVLTSKALAQKRPSWRSRSRTKVRSIFKKAPPPLRKSRLFFEHKMLNYTGKQHIDWKDSTWFPCWWVVSVAIFVRRFERVLNVWMIAFAILLL